MEQIVFEWNPIRIDVFLTKHFEMSRNFFHHLFENKFIMVNQKVVKKSYLLKNNDSIQLVDLKRFSWPLILDDAPNIELKILLEKDDYMIIYKPKWVLSHPSSIWDVKTPSVVGFLYHKFKSLPSIWNFIRAGLIHRLDKNTDWLMIIVKTEKWLAHFKSLFKMKSESHTILEKEQVPLRKFYRAFSTINPIWSEFLTQISNKLPYYISEIVYSKNTFLKDYKLWITKVLDYEILWNSRVKLDLEILTWRTHQIRFHLSNHWLPIIWDDLYGWINDEQMNLTSYRLCFKDPVWEYYDICIDDYYDLINN